MRVRKRSSTAFRNGWSVRGDSATVLCAGHLTCWPGSIKTGSPRAASIRPMAVTEKKYHVGLGPGDVGDYVLVPGDPFRTPLIAKHLDDAHEVAFSREYRTFTGRVEGVPVSAMSSGMGGPSVAIGVEELEMWTKAGIIGNDMETSTLLIVSRLRKMRAGTVCLCVDEVGAGEIHHLDPSYMDRMLAVAVDAIRRLIKRDASAAKRQ